MIYGACVLIRTGEGFILGVTRKDNQEDFGLPGGKVEPGESPLQAAIRELEEETGLKVKPMSKATLLYVSDKPTITYEVRLEDIVGELPKLHKYVPGKEAGTLFGWVSPETLTLGTFGKYNKALFKSIGINIKY
jgi:8-oxo-dGTP pyrophosphatase MutT (NUDIX family)